ncbi:MAG TPA: hypothetical protein DHV28_04745 [Ignavibacteriales bacterium]|nr:hypothetical protein [Ignavibacteriales bacterium]
MNSLIKIFLVFVILSNIHYAQDQCTFTGTPEKSLSYPLFGSTGTLKVLVILCKFTDDNYDDPPRTNLWPSTRNSMPIWGPSLVSTTIQTDYPDPSISGYFQDMSLNQLHIIGDVKFYQPIHEQAYYFISSGRGLGYLTEEILMGLNSQINFAEYDNWDPKDIDQDGKKNEPDGQVDFIAICFRDANFAGLDGSSYSGIAGITGYRQVFGNGTSQLILDNKVISAKNLLSDLGSGTCQRGILNLHEGLGTICHEFGHYMFGTTHYAGVGFHGLMDGEGTGVMNSFERIRLNWLQAIVVNNTESDVMIPDAISTGLVRRMNIPNSTEYFLIDNH